jgi:hypothetical protein
MTDLAEIKNNFESEWYIDIENSYRAHNTTVHVYQGVTLRGIDDIVQKVKLRKNLNERKTLVWSTYGALIAFAIWFVTGLVIDYYSHIGADTPLLP